MAGVPHNVTTPSSLYLLNQLGVPPNILISKQGCLQSKKVLLVRWWLERFPIDDYKHQLFCLRWIVVKAKDILIKTIIDQTCFWYELFVRILSLYGILRHWRLYLLKKWLLLFPSRATTTTTISIIASITHEHCEESELGSISPTHFQIVPPYRVWHNQFQQQNFTQLYQ